MKTYKEIEDLRENLKTTYPEMLKSGIINKEEFNIALRGMSLKIKENYEKAGFKTDFSPTFNILKRGK